MNRILVRIFMALITFRALIMKRVMNMNKILVHIFMDLFKSMALIMKRAMNVNMYANHLCKQSIFQKDYIIQCIHCVNFSTCFLKTCFLFENDVTMEGKNCEFQTCLFNGQDRKSETCFIRVGKLYLIT